MNKILSARDLCKSFAHNGGQNHILNHVDADIYEGDFTVVMGASGSGKSTLLYALSGMDTASAGQVIFKDQNIVKYSENQLARLRRENFGFVFQQMQLVSNLSLFENVAVSGYLNHKNSTEQVNRHTEELFEIMGISKVASHLPSQVSGGEQQRAAIARAVINSPELLFADEPTGALNRNNTTEVLNLLTKLNSEGQSILMVTHDTRAALRASRILYLEDGRIIGELTLTPYSDQEAKNRENQVNAWLSSMEW